MLNSKPIKDIRFIDIETVPQHKSFFDLSEKKQNIFKEKFNKEIFQIKDMPSDVYELELENLYAKQASFLPELGKIVCISIGKILPEIQDDKYVFKSASFTSENDKDILMKFMAAMPDIKNCKNISDLPIHLCAHYGKVFDFPFLAKRLILNGLPLTPVFDYAHLKPWELNYLIDTIDAWRFGRMDCNSSLDLLSDSFGIESPKVEMCGKDVKNVFYAENDLDKIAKYCESDVFALAQIYLKMKGDQRELIKSK